jgi:hypothetical protein
MNGIQESEDFSSKATLLAQSELLRGKPRGLHVGYPLQCMTGGAQKRTVGHARQDWLMRSSAHFPSGKV